MKYSLGLLTPFALLIVFVLSATIYLRIEKNVLLTTVLFIVLAIPIPLSLFSIPYSLISIGMFKGIANPVSIKVVINSILFLLVMILAGTYIVSYVCAFVVTIKSKVISRLIFLPVIHIFVFIVLYLLVDWHEKQIK